MTQSTAKTKPYLCGLTEHSISVVAENLVAAGEFARNYAGDYRTDYRNHNAVDFDYLEPMEGKTSVYVFSITKRN